MKGLIVLFLSIALFGIAWGYIDTTTREKVKTVLRQNMLPITAALVAVSLAVTFSINTTMRLV